jgi:hypothetical protein
MRNSVLATAMVLSACSFDAPSEPLSPWVPTNPLASLIASEGGTFALSRLGSQTSPPFVQNESVCDGLPWRDEIADTIFFYRGATFRRVVHNRSFLWRTLGVPEPQPMTGRSTFEMHGSLSGEGDALILTRSTSRGSVRSPFRIIGDSLVRYDETLGRGCLGERVPTVAVYTRTSE